MPLTANLQAMPRKWARFCLGVERFLLGELGFSPRGQTLVLAFSGGLDSTALLFALTALAPRLGTPLVAAHLDHGLRESSANEAEQAAALCADLGIACVVSRRDAASAAVQSGQGLEAASRQIRYAFLQEIRLERAPALIVTAHQQNDLAEDVLMRLVRGAGWPGLGGMAAWDPDRGLLRPFLHTSRETLAAFLADMGATYITDSSNADMRFRRNRIRENALPLLLEENPNFLETVSRLWRQAALDRAYFDGLSPASLTFCGERRILLEETRLRQTPTALRLRLFKQALDALGPGESLTQTLFDLNEAWLAKRRRTVFQFPGAKTARITREGVLFEA